MKTAPLSCAMLLLAACSTARAADAPERPAFVGLDGAPLAQANAPDPDGHVRHVTKPVLRLLRCNAAAPKGTVLLFPGGGYGLLAVNHEGARTAAFLNAQGFDVAQLDYTVSAGPATRDLALSDALAAWHLLRAKAKDLGLHGDRLGVMGYSAGGHLAARLTAYLPQAEQPDDVMLIYPAYLDETASGTRVPSVKPPAQPSGRMFALIAGNDNPKWVASTREYAALWKETGGAARLEVLKDGGHGFGMKAELPGASKEWPAMLADFLAAPPAPKPAVNPATVPVGGDNGRHRDKCAAAAREKFDLLMVGDSITHNLDNPPFAAVWKQFYAPRHALNLGYSGYRTENILWNLENGELAGQSPKVITLMIGTNNADAKNYPTHHNGEQIAGGIEAIVKLLRLMCPQSKIILLRCFPGAYGGPGPTSHRADLDRASELSAKLADNQHVFFCDVNHVFLNLDGSIKKELMPDYLHPNAEGAKQWAQAMEPLLAQLMGDASRDDGIPANTAVVPVPKLEQDSYDWYARHAEILKIKDAVDPEVVLIGDSITHFWGGQPKSAHANGPKAFDAVFGPYRTLNLGFGWDRTQNVLWRLDHGELDGLHPRAVVIHIGTNNTSQTAHARANTPAEIVEGIAAICARVRSKVPGVKIILTQVMPREEKPDHPRRAQIAETNRLLVEFAKANQLNLVDLAPKMTKPDGTLPRELFLDFCHPSEAGYTIWGDALRPLLPVPSR